MAHQGLFKPKNPKKYVGDSTNIVYRSSWEAVVMRKFDEHSGVKRWASEEIVIPYISPKDRRKHRYFPDFWVELVDRTGHKRTLLIEVKPKSQVTPPRKSRNQKRYITEMVTWGVNQAKWTAAKEFCEKQGWEWHIFTEDEIGLKF